MEDTDKIERNCEVEDKGRVDSNIYGDHGCTALAVLGCYRGDMTKKTIELRVPAARATGNPMEKNHSQAAAISLRR